RRRVAGRERGAIGHDALGGERRTGREIKVGVELGQPSDQPGAGGLQIDVLILDRRETISGLIGKPDVIIGGDFYDRGNPGSEPAFEIFVLVVADGARQFQHVAEQLFLDLQVAAEFIDPDLARRVDENRSLRIQDIGPEAGPYEHVGEFYKTGKIVLPLIVKEIGPVGKLRSTLTD